MLPLEKLPVLLSQVILLGKITIVMNIFTKKQLMRVIYYIIFFCTSTALYSQIQKETSGNDLYKDYMHKGDSLLKTKNFEIAVNYYSLALDFKEEIMLTLFKRGGAYFGNKEYENAIKDFSSVIELNSKNADAYYFRGLAYFNMENNARACEDLHKSRQLGFVTKWELYINVCPDMDFDK